MGFINNEVTRFPGGLTNVNVDDIFNSLQQLDPRKYHNFFEDFDLYDSDDWTLNDTGTAAVALADGDGGLLSLTTDVNIGDNAFLQKIGESFLPTPGKQLFAAFRFKVNNVTDCLAAIGLQITDATPLDATDGIWFNKAEDATALTLINRKNATTGSTASSAFGTLANDTFVEVAFFYDGGDRLYYAFNGTVQGYLDASSSFLPDTELTVSLAVQTAAAAARILTVDYALIANQR